MFIWADNLADSRLLILGNLKPHNGRLSTEEPFSFATRVGGRNGRWSWLLLQERQQEATLQMPAYSLLGDGQIPLNTEGGDREVKSTNTKQCHRMKLAVTPQPRRYEELWHVGLLPQEPHWLRASPGLGGRLVTDSGHTHRLSRHLGQWQTAAERGGADPGVLCSA